MFMSLAIFLVFLLSDNSCRMALENNVNNSIQNIIDPAYHTSISVKEYLEKNNLINTDKNNDIIIYTTASVEKEEKIINIFMPKDRKYKLEQIKL